MRTEALLWALATLYYAALAVIYRIAGGEAGGVTLLVLAAGFGGVVTAWTWSWRREQHHRDRAQDRPGADGHDEVGLVGVYPTASLRPLAIAAGMVALALGVVIGSWLSVAGAVIVGSQVALLVRDADG